MFASAYYTTLLPRVTKLFSGAVMTNSAHGAPLILVYLQLTYRFKIGH